MRGLRLATIVVISAPLLATMPGNAQGPPQQSTASLQHAEILLGQGRLHEAQSSLSTLCDSIRARMASISWVSSIASSTMMLVLLLLFRMRCNWIRGPSCT